MGPIQLYLELEVDRDREKRTTKLSQPAYIKKMLHRYQLQEAKTAKISMSDGAPVPNDKQATPKEIKDYQETAGSLMFAMLGTRPDIAFATSTISSTCSESWPITYQGRPRHAPIPQWQLNTRNYVGRRRFKDCWLFKRKRPENH